MKDFRHFVKKHDYLICIDSDGCVIDGMTVKHQECFGPGVIEIYGLQAAREELLSYWNKINLYSMTRGINRFKGLVMMLAYAVEKGYLDLDISDLKLWVETAGELSNRSLAKQIEENKNQFKTAHSFQSALDWSEWVNMRVAALEPEKKPAFAHAERFLRVVADQADIAVVSAANAQAVEKEFEFNRILDLVDVFMTQEQGSKMTCLNVLKSLGYDSDKIIMIGDSPGDIEASKESGVLYYPIIPGKEEIAWSFFENKYLRMFMEGEYKTHAMQDCEEEYYRMLG